MTRRKKLVLGTLALSLLVAAGLALLSPELRTFVMLKVAPARTRDGLLHRLEGPAGSVLVLLGTAHDAHLDTPDYSLAHLEAVLMHVRPARLLVESRPEQVAAGVVADGPVEMGYSSLLARAAGIPFDGIDWYDEGAPATARRTDDQRDDRMVDNLLARVAPASTTLVYVGFSHVSEFLPRLEARGYREATLSDSDKARLFDTAGTSPLFPAGMVDAVERRIARDEGLLASDPPNVDRRPVAGRADRLRGVIASRKALVARIRAVGERR